MKTIQLNTDKIKNMFQQLHTNFGGEMTHDNKEYTLEVNNLLGNGTVKGINFADGTSFLEFDMVFEEDLTLINRTLNNNPIYFAYCSDGHITHSFGENGEKRQLGKYQTGILTSNKIEDHVITFSKGVTTKTTLIVVNTAQNGFFQIKNSLNSKLRKVFFEKKNSENYVYIGSQNLKILTEIDKLQNIKARGIVRNLMIKGALNIILALELQHHTNDLTDASKNLGSLKQKELNNIKELSDFIKNYPENEYSIVYLSNKSGLSPSKLQEGFKILHNNTISEYIRNVRLDAAEDLIRTSNLNISEVVYSIGFTSRSYFSKIFKEKYHCNPSRYRHNKNQLAATA